MLLLCTRKAHRVSYHLKLEVVIVITDFPIPTADNGILLFNDKKSLVNDEITIS